jgi:WD40 repeat protein
VRVRLLGLVVAAALLAAPAAAHATLAFDVDPTQPTIWVSPSGDPAEATEIGGGLVLEVSPNGQMVAFEGFGFRERPQLEVYDVATGETRTLLAGLRETDTFAWSPDSTELAAAKGRESERHTLYVIDADGGGKTPIATGRFSGVSFSPDGTELVFGLAEKGNVPNFRVGSSDIVRAPVTGGPTTALTEDHVSSYPLWGPRGRIAFVRENEPRRAGGGSIDELVTTNAHGGRSRTLVKAKSGRYVNGPFPVVWSPAGDTLIANYVGYRDNAVAVDVATEGQTTLGRPQGSRAFAAVALTADGSTVLGYLGGVEYGVPYRTIASIPITGGESTVLKRGAFLPSWGG